MISCTTTKDSRPHIRAAAISAGSLPPAVSAGSDVCERRRKMKTNKK